MSLFVDVVLFCFAEVFVYHQVAVFAFCVLLSVSICIFVVVLVAGVSVCP